MKAFLGMSFIVLALVGFTQRASAASAIKLDQALALYVLNSVYYGGWPPEDNPRSTRQLRLGVVGKDPMGKALESVAKRAKASWFKGGRIDIIRVEDPGQLRESLHVLFVGEDVPVEQALKSVAGRPTLLIGNQKGFALDGGTMELVLRDERMSFVLNLDHLQQIGVTMHSRMKIRAAGFVRNGNYEPGRDSTR